MQFLKQSTVATTIVGPVLDSTGAEFTTLVLTDLNISKNGATPAAITSGTLTHVANGWYTLAFATGNVDTLGRLDITCTLSTKQLPPKSFMVLPATVFDALVTNATNVTGGLVAATATVSAAAGYIGSTTAAIVADASGRVDMGKALGQAVTLDANNVLNVSSKYWAGTAITATSIPVATAAGAAGGLMISGSNVGTTTFGALTVTGATTLTGAVSLGSTLGVTGTTTFAAINTGALGVTTFTASGAVALQSTFIVTGATTFTGNVGLSDGLTIAAPSTLNRAGITITGNGTGAGVITTGGSTGNGMTINGGASGHGLAATGVGTTKHGIIATGSATTGAGLNLVGGGTSGDGLLVTTTSGHGFSITATGTNKHGAIFTGGTGGTSDGVSMVAGTGGVDLRANRTGNLTGNVSGSVGSVTGLTASDVGAIKVKTDFLPSATAGTAGGVFIAGSNAATTAATWTVTGACTNGSTVLGATTMGTLTQTGAVSWGATTFASITSSGAVAFQSTFIVTASTALGAVSGSTLTMSGAVAFQSTFIVTGATTLTGAVTASNASNNIVGIKIATGGITSGSFAVDAIDAAAIAADVDAVIAGAVWNALVVTYGIAGSYGLLVETDLDATISSRLATAGYTAPTNLTASQIAIGVLDEPLATRTTSDTTGKVLNMLTQDSVTLSSEVNLNSIVGQMLDNGITWTYDRTLASQETIGGLADLIFNMSETGFTEVSVAYNLTNQLYKGYIAAVAVAVAASPAPTATTFASNNTAADNFWNDCRVTMTSGALIGQSRTVLSFTNTNGLFTFDTAWTSTPAAADAFIICRAHIHPVTRIADGVLSRNVSNVEATAPEHSLCTTVLAMLENSLVASPGNLVIYRTDGTTVHATKPVTTSASADPITSIQ